MNIERLVKKAQKGNDQAYLTLFQQYEIDIYRMAYVYVKNKEDALDLVQDVAYQSFKNIHTLKEPAYIKTWLLRITMNCAMNVLKKNEKIVSLYADERASAQQEDVALTVSMQTLLDTLKDEEKSIVLLKYYDDCTLQEIADVLNMPLGTAKSILYRALQKLRKQLQGDEYYG
ncbi:MAG: sigma-70 family RNA polymerase sigma factor [Caryophanon sp.]|nr:sigma-70 family RNA polymerase sigma factor [Caryophanon sp.]